MVAAATKIYETIGVYLGYATAQFKDFYEFGYFLIVGRVTKVPPPKPRHHHALATGAPRCYPTGPRRRSLATSPHRFPAAD
jgi:hypothetical protein